MTVLTPRPRGKVIYAEGRIEGVRIQRSTGLPTNTPKRRVREVLNNIYYEELEKIQKGVTKGRSTTTVGRSSRSGPTFRDAYEAYINRIDKPVSKDSRTRAALYLDYFKDTPLRDITKSRLNEAIRQIHYSDGKQRAPQTVRRSLSVLMAVLHKGEEVYDVTAPKVRMPSNKSPKTWDYFENDEVWRIVDAAKGDCMEPLIHFMLLMGARPIEALRLEWKDLRMVSPDRSTATFTDYKGDGTPAQRTLDMPEITYHMLEQYAASFGNDGRVIKKESGKPWWLPSDHDYVGGSLTTGPRKRVYDIFEKAGVRKLRPYDMRHTFATRLREAGCDLDELMEYMGHESVQMVRRYAHIKPARKRSIMRDLSKPIEAESNES